jgi:two-component sensor histidine kinase/CheY-like chemotaxis protein
MKDKATILAVDDTPESLALLVKILIPAGFDVRPADSGELALAAVAANTPDLILLDVRLKGMDGLEVCRRLKAGEATRHIPIILISAFADVKEWVEGLQLGAADYITKPFQTEELLTRIRTHLALTWANASLEQQAITLRRSIEELQSENVKRQRVEDELRRSLDRTDRSRRAMLSTMEDQKRAEEAVQASLREKEILLREIHHRVKNNMQVISSLLNMQAGHIKDENARRMLKEGQLRIRSMALVHEKLYQSRDLAKIDFAAYLRSLSAHLFQFFAVDADRIRLETDLEDVSLDIISAVPCGLVINELLTNALKYAFPGDRKGVVRVELHRGEDGTFELRVADDGAGFPEAVDFRRTDSLGLQIVNLLVGQLEGTIELDRTNGTAFTLFFRESEHKARA